MAANSSYLISKEDLVGLVPKFFAYFILGLSVFITNTIVFISIWRFKLLNQRKEYIVVTALAFTDAASGFAFCTAGISRLVMIGRGTANSLVTRWSCLTTPWNVLWYPTDYTYGATLAMVSLDRLFSWLWPSRYWNWDRRYSAALIAAMTLPYFPLMIAAIFYDIYGDAREFLPSICYTEWVHNISVYPWVMNQRSFFGWFSVFIYFAVLFKYRQQKAKITATLTERSQKLEMEKQRQLTKTIGISALITFLTEIAPHMVIAVTTQFTSQMSSSIIPIVGLLEAVNKLANPIVYIKRHHDIRLAIQCLFTGKALTQVMLNKQPAATAVTPDPKVKTNPIELQPQAQQNNYV